MYKIILLLIVGSMCGIQAAQAKWVVGVKDGLLFGRKCYYSDGSIRNTTQFNDCTEPSYIPRTPKNTTPAVPSMPPSLFKNALQAGERTMCFYENGTYVVRDSPEDCPQLN